LLATINIWHVVVACKKLLGGMAVLLTCMTHFLFFMASFRIFYIFLKAIDPNCFPCKLINGDKYDDDGETRSAW
jgi:hypothetical protein